MAKIHDFGSREWEDSQNKIWWNGKETIGKRKAVIREGKRTRM